MTPTSWSSPTREAACRRRWPCLALCLLVFLTASPARATVSVTDDAGREIVLPQPATRVVALYGAFNEILAGMGMADRIVARTEADATPPSIATLPVIGTHMRPNLEHVLAVKPDLVLQMAGRGEAEQAVEALSRLGVPVAVFSVTDFPGLYAAILRIGTLTGAKEAAGRLVAALQDRLAALAAKAAKAEGKARPKVFFEVRSGSLLAAGKGSMVDAVIAAAGGENAVAAEKKIVRLSDEELLRLAPDVCLTQRGPMNPEARPMTERPEYAALPCVKNGQAYLVDEALYSRPGPGSVDAAEALATLLAGDAHKEARP